MGADGVADDFPIVIVVKSSRGDSTIEAVGGASPYVWIGNADGCFTYVDDLRTLRKIKSMVDAVIAKRERRNRRGIHITKGQRKTIEKAVRRG